MGGASATMMMGGASATMMMGGASATMMMGGASATMMMGGASATMMMGGASATMIIAFTTHEACTICQSQAVSGNNVRYEMIIYIALTASPLEPTPTSTNEWDGDCEGGRGRTNLSWLLNVSILRGA